MTKAFISAISVYFPEKSISNDRLVEEFQAYSAEKIEKEIGVKNRYVCEENECASDIAIKAAKKLFKENDINAEEIDFVLFCTQSPDYFLPSSACIIQDKLGIPNTAGALDFNLGCSGYVYGLSLAKGLISSLSAKKVLLLTGETFSKIVHPDDSSNRILFGDGASATVISTQGFAEIGNFSFGTDGSGYSNLIVHTGGFRNPEKKMDNSTSSDGRFFSSDHLYMDGSEVFNFTLAKVPVLVSQTLKVNDQAQEDVDLFIFHQANKFLLEFLRKKIKIDKEKFHYCFENYGNTGSTTVPTGIFSAKAEGKLNGNILLAGFGVGFSWAGVILKTI